MSHEKFYEGRDKSSRAAKRRRIRLAILSAIAGSLIGATAQWSIARATKPSVWTGVTEAPPPPWQPLVVGARDGSWEAGYLNDDREFVRYCDGLRIRGAWRYIIIPDQSK